MFWMIVVAISLIIEALTMALISLWFAIGAIIAMLAAEMNYSLSWQIGIFFFVSLICCLAIRPIIKKYFLQREYAKIALAELVGRDALVVEKISAKKNTGKVKVRGVSWQASSKDPAEEIKSGALVTVESVENNARLLVITKN